MGVQVISEGKNIPNAEKVSWWRKRHNFTLIVLVLFALVLIGYNLPQFIRVQTYFMQDFQAMPPEERIKKFSWKMHIWRYRYLLISGLTPDDQFPQGTYIQEYFETFYPLGSPIEPFKSSLKEITLREGPWQSYCSEAKRKHLDWAKIEKYISKYGCEIAFRPYLSIIPMYWQWFIQAEYNNKTGKILKYHGGFGSTSP